MHVSDGFPYYIYLTEGKDIYDLFESQDNIELFGTLTEEKSLFKYEAGKWTIKEIIGHITDHERIMVYRSLRFSRGDTTILPGYDQDFFVLNAGFNNLNFQDIMEDYKSVRRATLSFMKLLSEEKLRLKGLAWKFELSVENCLRVIIGHEIHHVDVLKKRYNI